MPGPRRFDIRLWNAGAGLCAILAIALAVHVSMSRFPTERLLEREPESSREFQHRAILAERARSIVLVASTPSGADAVASCTSQIIVDVERFAGRVGIDSKVGRGTGVVSASAARS